MLQGLYAAVIRAWRPSRTSSTRSPTIWPTSTRPATSRPTSASRISCTPTAGCRPAASGDRHRRVLGDHRPQPGPGRAAEHGPPAGRRDRGRWLPAVPSARRLDRSDPQRRAGARRQGSDHQPGGRPARPADHDSQGHRQSQMSISPQRRRSRPPARTLGKIDVVDVPAPDQLQARRRQHVQPSPRAAAPRARRPAPSCGRGCSRDPTSTSPPR